MKMRLNLSNRISLGYLFIIAIATVATLFCISILRNNQSIDKQITNTYLPNYLLFKELNMMVRETSKLSNGWVYQSSAAEKKILQQIQETDYPQLKINLETIRKQTGTQQDNTVPEAITAFDQIIGAQKELMNHLADDSLYANDVAVDKAITVLEKKIIPQSDQLSKQLQAMISGEETKMNLAQDQKQSSYTFLTALLIGMILLFIAAAVLANLYSRSNIVKPISVLKDVIVNLGQGKVTQVNFERREDEIGEMIQAIHSLMDSTNAKSRFAEAIGKGNYTEEFNLLSTDDTMGRALLDMRENLQRNTEDEKKRAWATEGIAQSGALLRAVNRSTEALYADIIHFVVHYTQSNQGGLFLLNNDTHENAQLELVGCYAFERRKYLEKTVAVGEGLLGQCVLEREAIYITDIPEDYINITSGLGKANPKSLLIVPLKINDDIQGVIELASFNHFEQYEIDFIEKLAESIAATISNIKITDKTQKLLEEAQMQAEQTRSQEEEMRQNMEELSATQEEMHRKEGEYLRLIEELQSEAKRENQ